MVRLSLPAIRLAAGSRSFQRGLDYAREGRVTILARDRRWAEATVQGTSRYHVEVAVEDGTPVGSCTCPMGRAGEFCKHCVAVALAFTEPVSESRAVDLREHLEGLDRAELVDLVLQAAARDEYMARHLVLDAAGDTIDLDRIHAAVDVAFDTGGFVPYRDSFDFADGANQAIDLMERAVSRDRSIAAVEAVEYALAAWEEAIGSVDDSTGMMGELRDRLTRLHADACRRVELRGSELADRLFERALASRWEVFLDLVDTHGDLLGDAGLDRLADRIDGAWETKAEQRFTLRFLLEAIARSRGDTDALVASYARDLDGRYRYVQIAEALRDAGRIDEALTWVRRGLAEHPDSRDLRLVDLGVDLHLAQGDTEGAWKLVDDAFRQSPTAATYRRLVDVGQARADWAQVRSDTLGHFRAWLKNARAGFDPLVRALVEEGDLNAAWEAADTRSCTSATWRILAERSVASHPDRAAAVLTFLLDGIIAGKNKRAYAEAVEVMGTIRDCLTRAGRDGEFAGVVASVRANHKPKRNLMALLDQAGW